MNYRNINFGYASAEKEGVRAPELLLRGYLDPAQLATEALEGHRFLFLGYKGSGKSAIAERSRLRSVTEPQLFVRIMQLGAFPYDAFRSVVSGELEPESRYPTAWSWLLLLQVIDSLVLDQELMARADRHFTATVRVLRTRGLLPTQGLKELVLTTTKRTFKAQIPNLVEATTERTLTGEDTQMVHLVTHLTDLVAGCGVSNRHVVFIDGLDDVLRNRDIQYETLSALVLEVVRLNIAFQRHRLPVKIVLLCRTDLFERLPGSNKGKAKSDWAVELDWYHDPGEPESSGLISLVNLRAELSLGRACHVFDEFFPADVNGVPTQKFLLEHTRHTPRDFIELMRSIQMMTLEGQENGHGPTHDQIRSGLRDYSIRHFMPDVRDELDGYFSPDQISDILAMLGMLSQRHFRVTDLEHAAAETQGGKIDVDAVLRALFECSAIGSIGTRGRRTRYTFKYRNRASSLNRRDELVFHRGMWKALNLP